ncbi:hypothetical protein BD779DRAFT_1093969 [Infundibulicybe gibba]|nr:hypothetical protein BD779DRAFT_1093969 [Infundibulicybe gibba]
MVQLNTIVLVSSILAVASAAPLQKRIAQTIADSTADWEKACLAAGGAAQCNPISQTAFDSLLAAGGNCDQQNAADQMVDLAKTLGNDPEMIRLTQLFVQQPRNAPDSLQVPYCQVAPKNAELNGLFHCEFAGSDFTKFSGDQTGNTPLGVSAVNPPGSCPAKPDGPVPDGVQLNTLVQNPNAGGSATGQGDAAPSQPANGVDNAGAPPAQTQAAPPPPAASSAGVAPGAKSFSLQNGKDAKALNAKFATLTASSACTAGENACIGTEFAQCVNGKFVATPCAGGLICTALPLVNSPGTSVACDTAADRDARIAETGA